jgi:hypothetical protein
VDFLQTFIATIYLKYELLIDACQNQMKKDVKFLNDLKIISNKLQIVKKDFIKAFEFEIFIYIVSLFINFTFEADSFLKLMKTNETFTIKMIIFESIPEIIQFLLFTFAMDRVEKMVIYRLNGEHFK